MKNPFGAAARADRWYTAKSRMMEEILGKEHDMVMHAIIPYAVGGGLDLYYYPNGVSGAGVATKELSDLPGKGSKNRELASYELVMFTRHAINLDEAREEQSDFGKAHSTINSILNRMAPYSEQASLNKFETCEFPSDMERVGGKCLIFDTYGKRTHGLGKTFGVLVVIEIFRTEMEFARANGGAALLEKLREKKFYPYSDMDREPVV